jgi:hypothetical protein
MCVVHELYLYLFLCAKGVMLFIIGKKNKIPFVTLSYLMFA